MQELARPREALYLRRRLLYPGSVDAVRSAHDANILDLLGQADELVTLEQLRQKLDLSSEYLARRFFDVFDHDKDGRLGKSQLIASIERLADGPPERRLRFAFDVHDEDGNGVIDHDELDRMLHIALAENGIVVTDQAGNDLVDAMFRHADADGDGYIDFDEFRAALEHYPGVLEHMTLGDLRWLGIGGADPKTKSAFEGGAWFRTHGAWVVLLTIYLVANALAFWWALSSYRDAGAHPLVQVARGCGACLNLNAALIFVPMMRRALSWVGRTRVGRLLIDDHVAFHRLVGSAAFYFAIAHTIAHALNYARGEGVVVGLGTFAGATGAVLLVVHAIMWVFASEGVRRRGRFELFRLTHALYPLWALLILLHGPVMWLWIGVPLAFFVLDRASRVVHSVRAEAEPLASRVTRLVMPRPSELRFEAGDYAFLRVAELAKSEWHPFTISSAPEREDELTFHVRTAGDWTGALRELAEAGESFEVDIDGPYGTPSAHIFDAKVAVLVGAGIGVTPFASVLESLVEKRRRGDPVRLEKVYFVWVSRDQAAFEWFAELLARLERDDPDLFSIRIFMDAGRTDLSSTVLRVAMDVLYAETREDLMTGLRSRTTLGAPDWDGLFRQVAHRHAPDRVDVFFCGPPGLARKVEHAATHAGCPFRQEHF